MQVSAWCLCETSLGNLSLVTVLLSDGQKQTQGCVSRVRLGTESRVPIFIIIHTYIYIYFMCIHR